MRSKSLGINLEITAAKLDREVEDCTNPLHKSIISIQTLDRLGHMQRRKLIFAGAGLMGAIACGRQDRASIDRSLANEPNHLIATNKTAQIIDPAAYLKQLKPPKFKPGHTLPPLTRFGWTLPFETRVELADRWGYTLEWGPYAASKYLAQAMANPKSVEAKTMALAGSQPDKYQLSVILNRDLPTAPDAVWLHNDRGELIDSRKIWSPEAPDIALQAAAKLCAEPLQQIHQQAPIAVVLNGGEYGLGVSGSVAQFCGQDPTVLSAKGSRSWFDYLSERKAYQESFIAEAVRAVVPNRRSYVYYPADSNPHHDRYWGWKDWCFDYKYMRAVTDYPSSSTYFQEFNTGWTGDMDLLTEVLNSVGQQIQFGDPLSYNWVCSGWMRGDKPVFGELDRYMGFLKCYYTAGMLGGIAGYFSFPDKGFTATFPADRPPNWLQQMTVLARVHGLFSYLEKYLRQGDLLPGPNRHRWSKDMAAYEFPTEDPDLRVLARKDRQKSDWLITAWSAAGSQREVKVTIPQLGLVSLLARPSGSVYTAKIDADRPTLKWIDRSYN